MSLFSAVVEAVNTMRGAWPTVPTKLSLARVVEILGNDEITAYYSYIAGARVS